MEDSKFVIDQIVYINFGAYKGRRGKIKNYNVDSDSYTVLFVGPDGNSSSEHPLAFFEYELSEHPVSKKAVTIENERKQAKALCFISFWLLVLFAIVFLDSLYAKIMYGTFVIPPASNLHCYDYLVFFASGMLVASYPIYLIIKKAANWIAYGKES